MSAVSEVRKILGLLSSDDLCSVETWAKLLPEFGFNDENPNELPKTMLSQPGLGLRIWQYPNQFEPYMSWLASQAGSINSYLEIGTRHGGTFVTQVETLRRLNPAFNRAVAVDLIEQPSLLESYEYRQQDSGSESFRQWIDGEFFDVVFVDGDHSYGGVANDAAVTIDRCNIQIFHDISSHACVDVPRFWREHREACHSTHDVLEFTAQYEEVAGDFLGIGVLVRKDWIT